MKMALAMSFYSLQSAISVEKPRIVTLQKRQIGLQDPHLLPNSTEMLIVTCLNGVTCDIQVKMKTLFKKNKIKKALKNACFLPYPLF